MKRRMAWTCLPRAARALCVLATPCLTVNAAEILTLRTVTSDGAALAGSRLEWWPDDGRRNKRQQVCEQARCATWRLQLDEADGTTLRLVLLVDRPGEARCWNHYTGVVRMGESEKPLHEAVIALNYAHAICN